MSTTLISQEQLLAQPADHYMNNTQLQFFRALLIVQRDELQVRISEEFEGLRERETSSDPADIGSAEEQRRRAAPMAAAPVGAGEKAARQDQPSP